MSAMFDIHPDMDEVIAAKQAVAQVTDPDEMRAAWNASNGTNPLGQRRNFRTPVI